MIRDVVIAGALWLAALWLLYRLHGGGRRRG
jgi:hypothetical protein